MTDPAVPGVFRSEMPLWAGAATALLFLIYGDAWLADLSRGGWYLFVFSWLFVVMLWLAFNVVRHADSLAVKLGEPYGTLILTVSVISIEVVMIAAVMITGESNPTLARDTLREADAVFAALDVARLSIFLPRPQPEVLEQHLLRIFHQFGYS